MTGSHTCYTGLKLFKVQLTFVDSADLGLEAIGKRIKREPNLIVKQFSGCIVQMCYYKTIGIRIEMRLAKKVRVDNQAKANLPALKDIHTHREVIGLHKVD